MKRIVVCGNKYYFHNVKEFIFNNQLIKKYGLEIKSKCKSYIILKKNDILKEDVQIIFKLINYNRPADFYKYKENDIFLYNISINDINLVEFNKNKLFFQNFKKPRKLEGFDSIDSFLMYLPTNTKYCWNIYKNREIRKCKIFPMKFTSTFSKKLPCDYFETEEEAKQVLINRLNEQINNLQYKITSYKKELENTTFLLEKLKEV